jgi:signal transduction histidine kinase/FixJ family two-component response regulator
MQQRETTTISRKIILSYITIVLLAAAAIGILYQGIHNIIQIDTTVTKPNYKLKKINHILTLVYEAENYSRSYFIFRNDSILKEYINTNKKISEGIDSLKIHCISNERQVNALGEIAVLLQQKGDIIDQLEEINKNTPEDISYTRFLEEVYFNSYENTNQPLVIRQNKTTRSDSIFELKEQKGLLGKVKKVFTSEPIPDQRVFKKVSIEETVTFDTIMKPVASSNNNMIHTLEKALDNFKNRNEFIEKQFVSHETQLLHSDRIILDKIRTLVTSLETEEIEYASGLIARSQDIIKQSTSSVTILGTLAFFLALFFLFIIYRDVARSRAYQKELQRARQYSDDLVQLKEQFVANMSHEIRTPLTTIIGFAEQLKNTGTTSDQKVFIQNIEHASKHLHGLVNNVLDLSKSNAGKLTLEETTFSIYSIINDIQNIFSVDAKKKGILLKSNCYFDPGKLIKGDPFRLKQVLINIVGNAIKFTEKGCVELFCSFISHNENEEVAEIIISDTGIGIPESKIARIFDEFTQADTDTTRKFGGSGLGLSISKKIVDLMHGSIKVESNVGQGSRFVIEIPFKKCDQIEEIAETNEGYDEIPISSNILIVEDDEPIRLLLTKILSNKKINADIVSSGPEAINKLKSGNYNLVLTDIQMPGMSGFELIKAIHEEISPELPVIAFTANVSIKESLKKAGFSGHIEKPFSESTLLNTISKFIGMDKVPENQHADKDTISTSKEYSLLSLKEFTGDDAESMQQILQSFIKNTLDDLVVIQKNLDENNIKAVAGKIHKMLPMFRQLKISKLIDEMQIIERYEELDVDLPDVKLFTENFLENARSIIEKIQIESIYTER